jgi:hypothetical protein
MRGSSRRVCLSKWYSGCVHDETEARREESRLKCSRDYLDGDPKGMQQSKEKAKRKPWRTEKRVKDEGRG